MSVKFWRLSLLKVSAGDLVCCVRFVVTFELNPWKVYATISRACVLSHNIRTANHNHNQSINPLAWTECGDSLPFSGASSIPPCHTLFPATRLRQPFFHPPALHPAIYFLVYLLVLLFPNSCTILFWKSYFLPFSVHVQTNVIYAALLSLL